MKLIRILCLCLIGLWLVPVVALARPEWQMLKTDHFTIFYSSGHETEAWQLLAALEYYRPQVEKLCGNEVFHFPFVIDDTGLLVNGFTDPVNKRIHVFEYPPDQASSLGATENWWSMVGVHEYTHELSLTKTTGSNKILQDVFGNDSFWMPNVSALPGWVFEGITVYSESQLTPYQGRLNDGYFDSYIGARVRDGRFPSILDATFEPIEFQASGIYTYGGEFFNYLSNVYGPEKFARFFEVNGESIPLVSWLYPIFGADRSARKVYGKSLPELWKDWKEYEIEHYRDYRTDGEVVPGSAGSVIQIYFSEDMLYYERQITAKTGAFQDSSYYELVGRNLESGRERILVSTHAPFTMSIRVKNGKLYYGTHETKTGYANSSQNSIGYYALIHRYDLESGRDQVIFSGPIRAYDISANGEIILSEDRIGRFGSMIYQFNPATGEKRQLFEGDFLVDEIVSDVKRTVTAARKDWQNFNIYQLDLETGSFKPLVATPYSEGNITLQGERLLFNANYSKQVAGYSYDFSNGKVYRLTENGYAANPILDEPHQELYYIGLSSYDFTLNRKPVDFKEYQVPALQEPTPPIISLPQTAVTRGGYWDNLKTLAPLSWMPIVNVDENRSEYGVSLTGGDAVMDFPFYMLELSYDAQRKKVNSNLNMTVNYFAPWQISLKYSNVDKNFLALGMAYPLVTRLSDGLTDLSIGTSMEYQADFPGLTWDPFVKAGWEWPRTSMQFKIDTPLGKTQKGDVRNGWYTDLEIKRTFTESQLTLDASRIIDPANPHTVLPMIRGYSEALPDKDGQVYSLEYSQPVLKIRNGFWNPNIYFEDLFATAFVDQAVASSGDRQAAWGLELHLETKMMYDKMSPLDWGLRITQNQEGEECFNLFFRSVVN